MKNVREDTMMQAHPDQSMWQVMSFKKQHLWIDRKDKRIIISLPCRVANPGGKICDAEIMNLSAGGMKLACNRSTFEQLVPEGLRTPGMISDIAIEISFTPEDQARKQPAPIDAHALIIHSERLSQDSYHVGIQFTELNEADTRRISAVIDAVLTTNQAG